MMRVLITGHRGYIGPWAVHLFQQAGHRVTGCDVGLFDGCAFDRLPRPDVEWNQDFRNLTPNQLVGFDVIVHLAAISNDPMGDLDPQLTRSINLDGTVAFAEAAKAAGVPRFLLSSSCSVYGKTSDGRAAHESSPLAPLSVYAESKIESERRIGEMKSDGFAPVFLRNATAYGYSPMLRVDLVLNNLLGCALTRGEIRIHSDGSPWRPLIHCKDIAAAFLAIAEAPVELTSGLPINIGSDVENYRVRDVAALVGRLVPGASVRYTGRQVDDPRDYRVSFARLRRLLPEFKLEHDLESGAIDLHRRLVTRRLRRSDFEGPRYVRLETLKRRLDTPAFSGLLTDWSES